jgi:O-antigen ligase
VLEVVDRSEPPILEWRPHNVSTARSRSAAWYAVAACLAIASGALVAAAPVGVAYLAAAAAVGVGALVVVRVLLAPANGGVSVADGMDEWARAFGASRAVFYAGTALLGFLTIRPVGSYTASDLLYFASFGLAGLAALRLRAQVEYVVPRAITLGASLFALGGLISSFGAAAPNASIQVVVKLVYLTLAWFWLATIVLRNRAQVEIAVLLWVLSAASSSAGAVVQFYAGSVIPGGDVHWGRMTGFTPHFNNLGGLAATAFVPALMLAVDARRVYWRVVALSCLVLLVAGLMLSGSVGALLAASVSTVLWLTLRGVTARTIAIFAIIAIAGIWMMSAVGYTSAPSPLKRIVSVTSKDVPESEGGTLYSRIDVYRTAWGRIEEQPFVGVGLDPESSEQVLGPDLLVHNIILNPWFSAGLLGVVGICFLLAGVLRSAADLVRRAGTESSVFVSALFSSVVAFVVFAMGEPILFVRYGWFPTAMLLALRAHQIRRAREPVPADDHEHMSAPRIAHGWVVP